MKQKFYKGSSKARGSGIGLAVCDEIIRAMAALDIGNAEGGGSVVTIRRCRSPRKPIRKRKNNRTTVAFFPRGCAILNSGKEFS